MDLFNWLSDGFQSTWARLYDILPKCPLYYLDTIPEIKPYLSMLNWFMPISTMISIGVAWAECILIYYIVQVILRWLKVIE